jgi:hypothetical protein
VSEHDEGQGADPATARLDRPLACWHESLHSARTDRMVSLGEQGGFIETDRPLPAGAEVFLELHLGHASNAARGEIDGLVVDNGGKPAGTHGFEVQFLDLDDAVRLWIRRHIGLEPARASFTQDVPTRELAEAAKARGDVPEGFEIAPSVDDQAPSSTEGFAIDQPHTLEYAEHDSAPTRPAPGPGHSHQSSPYETTQRMYAAPGPAPGEGPKPLPVSPASLAEGSGSAPSAPAPLAAAPPPATPSATDSGPVSAAPVIDTSKPSLDISAAIEEISAPNLPAPTPPAPAFPAPSPAAAPASAPLPSAGAPATFGARHDDIEETRPFGIAPGPKHVPAPLPIKVADAHDLVEDISEEEGFDVEFSVDDGAPAEGSGPSPLAADIGPEATTTQTASPVHTDVPTPAGARLSAPDDNLAGPNPAAPGPTSIPHTDPGEDLPSIAIDLSDEEEPTEAGAPTLQLEEALFGDLSGEADVGRETPLASLMDQEPAEAPGTASGQSKADLEAAFFTPDAIPPSPEEPIPAAVAPAPATPLPSFELPVADDDGLPAIELDAVALEGAEIAGVSVPLTGTDAADEGDNVATLEIPAGGANPNHMAGVHRPLMAPPAIPSAPARPLGPPAAQLLGSMPSAPGGVPASAIRETQPFGVDASEIQKYLSGGTGPSPVAGPGLGGPETPPMGTPAPSYKTPNPFTSTAAPAVPAAPPLSTPPARQTLQFSAAAVQAELQRSAAATPGRGSTDPQFPAVNPISAPPAQPAPSPSVPAQSGPPPARTPTDQQFPAVTLPAGLPKAATLMEPEDVVEVNTTSQLVRVATDEHGDIQSIQSTVGPVVTGAPQNGLKLEVPDAAGAHSAVTVDATLFAEPRKELNPFDDWSVLENKSEDELPVIMGTDSQGAKEPWVAAARPPVIKPDGEE